MMIRLCCKLVLVGVFACSGMVASTVCATPKAVKASYAAYMNGMAIGVITEHFDVEGPAYRIVSETKSIGLAAFIQRHPVRVSSSGQLTREGLRPSHFESRRNAADLPQVSADFDWSLSQVTLKHDGKIESLPLSPGTQDLLSIMYQFMFMRLDKTRAVEFSMTNGRKLDRYRYRITPDVEIDTALGRLKTLHLVKERDVGDRGAEVWLSPLHQQLPVKVVITEKDGKRFEHNIQSLELRD